VKGYRLGAVAVLENASAVSQRVLDFEEFDVGLGDRHPDELSLVTYVAQSSFGLTVGT
jgi:hypothetical protein